MLDFHNKIKQVLSLEKEKGFQNSAVAGGLGNFLVFIKKHGEQNNINSDTPTQILNYFESYALLSTKDRKTSLDIIIDWLSEKPKTDIKTSNIEKPSCNKKGISKNCKK